MIAEAQFPVDVEIVRALFIEYADSLGFDLAFQGFDDEVATLPGNYAPPDGVILLARDAGAVALGCSAVRRLDAMTCEMKRLYVRPAGRGHGFGRALAVASVVAAHARGYAVMRLDTVPGMTAALALYRSLGFVEIPPYRHNPIAGAMYLELDLGAAPTASPPAG